MCYNGTMQVLDFIYQNTKYLYWITFIGLAYILIKLVLTLLELLKEVTSILNKVTSIKEKTTEITGKLDQTKKALSFDKSSYKTTGALATILLVLLRNTKKHDLSVKGMADVILVNPKKKSDNYRMVKSLSTLASTAKTALKS